MSYESPEVMLSLLACICLEKLALDFDVNENLRKAARVGLYTFQKLNWDEVESNEFLCHIVNHALRKCESDGFLGMPPHQRGDIRSMMGDIVGWLEKNNIKKHNTII